VILHVHVMVSFADVAHQLVSFDPSELSGALALKIIDTPWLQRLRDLSQTANTRLVFMFSEHSRFGHTLGVAHLANLVLSALKKDFPAEIKEFGPAVIAAALLHDVGHLAPGSHTAWGTWYPDQPDEHEDVGCRIISDCFLDPSNATFSKTEKEILKTAILILSESSQIPAWTWQIISGGGWNADRGNWCIVDSVLAGVSYGRYNIEALIESFSLSKDKELVVRENRLDALSHFAVSRHAMYEQLYQHRVIMASDCINKAIAKRARALGASALPFCDTTMDKVLQSKGASDLSLDDIFAMREPWWRYHVSRWSESPDPILSDLSLRLLNRRLFKTVRIGSDEAEITSSLSTFRKLVIEAGFDPEYYLFAVTNKDTHTGDTRSSMKVLLDTGEICPFDEAAPLFKALLHSSYLPKAWLAMPEVAKKLSGKTR
jgi:HD superfamily phosphohydrolase